MLSEYENKTTKSLNDSCLRKEIMLCNKFLEKDDRNFHVWNYRLTIFKMVYQYFRINFWDFLKEELDFTLKMIKKSFSNFSAWHYRSKLINLDLVKKNISWSSEEVLEYLKEDLFYIKNAIFTDPRDQSPWNYYYWILSNITPIYIKSVQIEKHLIKIKLSQKIPIYEFLELKITQGINDIEINLIKEYIENDAKTKNLSISDCFGDEICLNFSKMFDSDCIELQGKFSNLQINEKIKLEFNLTLKAKEVDVKNILFTDNHLNLSNNICPLKNNLDFPVINLIISSKGINEYHNSYESTSNFDKYNHLRVFLKNQLEMVNDLIVNTDGFIENAHSKKAQIMILIYHLKFQDYLEEIKKELTLLVEKSKRTKEIYRKLIESI